jgi:hypothetical protein
MNMKQLKSRPELGKEIGYNLYWFERPARATKLYHAGYSWKAVSLQEYTVNSVNTDTTVLSLWKSIGKRIGLVITSSMAEAREFQ